MANLIPMFQKELSAECATTRKMFERIPEDQFDWKPHAKSMPIKRLATHIAEMPEWIAMAFTRNGFDFAEHPYKPREIDNKSDLFKFMNEMEELGESHLRPEFEEKLMEPWLLKNGDTVLVKYNRAEVIRMALNQITHHRAQLGVYLRMLEVPIPGSYGPSADER